MSHVAEPSCKLDLPELKPDVFPPGTLNSDVGATPQNQLSPMRKNLLLHRQ